MADMVCWKWVCDDARPWSRVAMPIFCFFFLSVLFFCVFFSCWVFCRLCHQADGGGVTWARAADLYRRHKLDALSAATASGPWSCAQTPGPPGLRGPWSPLRALAAKKVAAGGVAISVCSCRPRPAARRPSLGRWPECAHRGRLLRVLRHGNRGAWARPSLSRPVLAGRGVTPSTWRSAWGASTVRPAGVGLISSRPSARFRPLPIACVRAASAIGARLLAPLVYVALALSATSSPASGMPEVSVEAGRLA